MPLDRVTGKQSDVLVDHADGRVGHCVRVGLTPVSVEHQVTGEPPEGHYGSILPSRIGTVSPR